VTSNKKDGRPNYNENYGTTGLGAVPWIWRQHDEIVWDDF